MRIRALKIFYVITLTAILIRLFYWQIIRFDDLSALADQQHLTTYALDAPRGLILASDGSPLAMNQPTFLMYGLPKVIKDKDEVAEKLAKIIVNVRLQEASSSGSEENIVPDPKEIETTKDGFTKQLGQDLYWVSLDKSVDLPTKTEIEKLNLDGIGFEEQLSRFYPEASTAAHVLGFAGSDSLGRQKGYFGLEGFYNGELQGVGGILTEEKDARGLPIAMGKFLKKEPENGHTLILNIDRTIQYMVEKKLKDGVSKYGAKSGSAVVMDPKTGAILAMSSFPNYDPNSYADFPRDDFKNSIVADSYEPGSTFKSLVMAAAINENLITPETKCDICSGPVEIDGYKIRTWDNHYFPDSTMTDVLVHSDNTGMVFVGKKLGIDKMYQYIQDFGFGMPTRIDLQDEFSPDIRSKDNWKEIDLDTSTFGQGIAVTPIQMVRAVGAIANGGFLMEPQVVKAIQVGDKVTAIKPKIVGHPITSQTAKTVTQMMVDAVEKGEAKVFAIKDFKIAGKTGTAQIPVAGHYDPNKTIASFVGFAPADNPKFVMLVIYQQPSASIYGAETAAPTFFSIAKELLPYLNIAPSE
ncbi:MAG: penicillin-binding protein 2 [Patescibacteria group bacterium]|nr:penicillin-binding protein 2 [Patescibacteria group bacterium]